MATSKYAQTQVAKMIINPYCGDVLSEYPRLKEVIGNTNTKHITQQIAFLSWVYDFNSPAVRDFSDINKRKEWARLETEITQDPSYELAVSFLTKVVKSRTWTLICSLESTFTEYAERVAKRIEDSENGKEIDILKNKNDIVGYSNVFWGGITTLELSKAIDFVLAFPQADLEEDIWMQLPIGFQVDGQTEDESDASYVLKLNKT